jgi:hypothetical protein
MEYKLARDYLQLAAEVIQNQLESAAPEDRGIRPSSRNPSLQPTALVEY